MKHIDFIDIDLDQRRFLDGKGGTKNDAIRECDHTLEITMGTPRDILGCPKCGWWQFLKPNEYIPKNLRDRYGIVDKRTL